MPPISQRVWGMPGGVRLKQPAADPVAALEHLIFFLPGPSLSRRQPLYTPETPAPTMATSRISLALLMLGSCLFELSGDHRDAIAGGGVKPGFW